MKLIHHEDTKVTKNGFVIARAKRRSNPHPASLSGQEIASLAMARSFVSSWFYLFGISIFSSRAALRPRIARRSLSSRSGALSTKPTGSISPISAG
jgi:hypothetical protein